jgi:hypothetical protein
VILVNLAHPVSDRDVSRLGQTLGEPVTEVRQQVVQLDPGAPFTPQVRVAVDNLQLDGPTWQGQRLVVHLPGLAPAAALVLAELHGRIGGFPPVLRMRRDEPYSRYVFAELLDLQAVREQARQSRSAGER